jgi:heptaprenyl diphosphate synthase
LNARKGGHFAAQGGFYAVSAAMDILKDSSTAGVAEVLGGAISEMCLGELEQLRVENLPELQTRENYILRIGRKTGQLIKACCIMGAMAAGLSEEQVAALGKYGEFFGLAFQLRDDLLDFEGAEADGKALFQDLKRGIYTLPLICALEKDFGGVSYLLEKARKSPENLKQIAELAKASGGVAYTELAMDCYIKEAEDGLSAFGDCEEKAMLEKIVRSPAANVMARV